MTEAKKNDAAPKSRKVILTVIAAAAALVLTAGGVLAGVFLPKSHDAQEVRHNSTVLNAAKNCMKCAQSAIENEENADGITYIVTNLPGESDVNAPYDTADVHNSMARFFPEMQKYQATVYNQAVSHAWERQTDAEMNAKYLYFFVVEGENVTYAAVWSDTFPDLVGSYPYYGDTAPVASEQAVGYGGAWLDVTTGENTFRELFADAQRMITVQEDT